MSKSTKKAAKKVSAKKTAAKKTVAKKAPAKKAAPKKTAVKKTSAKKVPAKKTAAKKAVAKKSAPTKKQAPAKKAVAKKATGTKKAQKASSKSKSAKKAAQPKEEAVNTTTESEQQAKELMLSKRTRKQTPSIFKIKGKKAAPVVFTLDDVRSLIDEKRKEEQEEQKEQAEKRAKVKKAKAQQEEQPAQRQAHKSASLADILGFNPATKKSPSESDLDNIPKKWHKYYKELLGLRTHVVEEIDFHSAETLKRSSKEDSGDLSGYGQHMADAGTDAFDRDFALSLVSSEQEALYEIEQAIGRIRKGTYGTCEITGKPIPKERLMAVPFTRYSLEGQRELESQRRTQRRASSANVFAEASDEDAANLAEDDS